MLRLYNYFLRKVEKFKPVGETVGLYTCGPTVYDFVHIGNWRTFVFEDILKRVLTFNGYKVKHVMNITDIDDKIINKAKMEKTPINELTKEYEDAFLQDLQKLNIIKADEYPRATEHISSIIRIIELLVKKSFAYEKDGSIYFSIGKFKDYGRLSGTNIKGVKAGARVDVDEYDKENPQDFALWKKEDAGAKARHEAFDSPWGIGRPGWHIECSAMSMEYLGDPSTHSTSSVQASSGSKIQNLDLENFRTIDIHTGGVDLLFPHHENEIAQSEAATGKKFVNYWLEGEHLLVNGEKMAKRLSNIYTLADIIKKAAPAGRQGFEPLALRYLFLTAHYRSKLNFTWKSLEAAQNALENFKFQISNFKLPDKKVNPSTNYTNRFQEVISNDLDMPSALAIARSVIRSGLGEGQMYATLLEMDEVLGLGLDKIEPASLPKGAKELIEKREELRSMGEFEESDKIRDELKEKGVEVEDTPEGPKWKVKK